MLLKDSLAYKKTFETQLVLKWVEVALLCGLLVTVFWYLYTGNCPNEACSDIAINYSVFRLMMAIVFPIASIIGSLRIASVFMLIDPDEQKENWFYISLAGIATSYSFFGIFYNAFYERVAKNMGDNWVLLSMLVLLIFTVGSLLREKQTWDKSNFFIKFRVSFNLINLILLVINPVAGLLLTILFTPFLVLVSEGKIAKPLFDLSGDNKEGIYTNDEELAHG
jgi:hypothetical protein